MNLLKVLAILTKLPKVKKNKVTFPFILYESADDFQCVSLVSLLSSDESMCSVALWIYLRSFL